MKSIQTFLEEFNCIPFEEKPTILLQAWFKFFAIKHAQFEDSNELFQKLLEDLMELTEYKEYLENSSKEIATSSSNQEKEGPPQDSNIRQLIREECCIEVREEQKNKMEDTILELVKISRQKELLCMHDNIEDLIESALDFKLLSINSQRLDKKKQEIKNVVEQSAEHRTRIVESLQNFRVIHKSSISLNNTENEVTSEDKKECDMPISENSPICDDHSEIFSNSKNDDDISSDKHAFEDIEYVEASLSDPEINDISDDSSNDPLLEEADLFLALDNSIPPESDNSLSDNFLPKFETFCDHMEETRSGSTTHANDSLPEYDSFCFEIELDRERLINVVKNDIFDDSSNDPLLEEADLFLASDNSIPPDAEFNKGEEISVVMNVIDKLECLNLKDEFDDDDYSSPMFVIYSKVFSLLLSAKSEDTIFDPGISV
nr:hypothetical protein [Tanacetum cinerariifolium]